MPLVGVHSHLEVGIEYVDSIYDSIPSTISCYIAGE